MMSSPLSAMISMPLRVTGTPSTGGASGAALAVSVMGAPVRGGRLGGRDRRLRRARRPLLHALADVGLELGPEPLEGRRDGRDGRGSERADRGLLGRPGDPRADVVADVHQQREVTGAAIAVEYALEDALQP